MLALYRCGRQADALEAYRQARQTLVEEIGIEPSAELRGLHDAMLRQDPSLDVEPATAELPPELDAATAPPLTGRDRELRRLRALWRDVAGGAGALVTLVGAYGMGKTRVAAEIAGDVHREGAAAVYVAGSGAPEAALPRSLSSATRAGRPCSCSTTPIARPPTSSPLLRDLWPAIADRPAMVLVTGQEAAGLARLAPRDSIHLDPLQADAVRLIARFYASPSEDAAVPVESLLAASLGVPRRVHEAAGEWARQEAMRRVGGAAGRTAAGRSEARALEDELAGNVVDLETARERVRSVSGTQEAGPTVCPYKGLATYDSDDAEYFFGRERLVAELVARLVGAPLLAVVGPSGSGKSSVVRAGLLPALAGGVLPGSDGWARALIRPGAHPLRELRRALDRGDRRRSMVLVVDQFEELFTACQDERERGEFVAELLRARARARARRRDRRPARRLLRPMRRPTRSSRACWARATSSSARWRPTSCDGRSSDPPCGSA